MSIRSTEKLLSIGDRWLRLNRQLLQLPRQDWLPTSVAELFVDPMQVLADQLAIASQQGQRHIQPFTEPWPEQYPTVIRKGTPKGPLANAATSSTIAEMSGEAPSLAIGGFPHLSPSEQPFVVAEKSSLARDKALLRDIPPAEWDGNDTVGVSTLREQSLSGTYRSSQLEVNGSDRASPTVHLPSRRVASAVNIGEKINDCDSFKVPPNYFSSKLEGGPLERGLEASRSEPPNKSLTGETVAAFANELATVNRAIYALNLLPNSKPVAFEGLKRSQSQTRISPLRPEFDGANKFSSPPPLPTGEKRKDQFSPNLRPGHLFSELEKGVRGKGPDILQTDSLRSRSSANPSTSPSPSSLRLVQSPSRMAAILKNHLAADNPTPSDLPERGPPQPVRGDDEPTSINRSNLALPEVEESQLSPSSTERVDRPRPIGPAELEQMLELLEAQLEFEFVRTYGTSGGG